MSIATEITRLQDAKGAIKTAIEGKGVPVPTETLLGGYASLIGDIVAGGGLPSSITKLEGGIFVPGSANLYYYDISHSLGVTPAGFVFWTSSSDVIGATAPNRTCFFCGLGLSIQYSDATDGASYATFTHFYRHTNGNMMPREAIFTTAEAALAFNASSIRIGISPTKTVASFYNGATYHYLIFA